MENIYPRRGPAFPVRFSKKSTGRRQQTVPFYIYAGDMQSGAYPLAADGSLFCIFSVESLVVGAGCVRLPFFGQYALYPASETQPVQAA